MTLLSTTGPSPRSQAALAYDDVNRSLVLFGGVTNTAGNTFTNETWLFVNAGWQPANPAISPSARRAHVMGFDGQRVVLVGGYTNDATNGLVDSWVWDGATWTTLLASGPAIPPRGAGVIDGRRRFIVHGGQDPFSPPVNETYVLLTTNTPSWLRNSAQRLPPTIAQTAVYDPQQRATLFVGGRHHFNIYSSNTWRWDGVSFSTLDAGAPPPRMNGAAAYDDRANAVVFTGGTLSTNVTSDATWLLVDGGWSRVDAGSPGLAINGLAFDSARGRTVMFGPQSGSPQNTTLELGPTGWLQRVVTGPGARSQGLTVWDSSRQRVLLFGGIRAGLPLNDFWDYDGGAAWTSVTSSTRSPPERAGASGFFDTARGRFVVTAGTGTQGPRDDTWEFDGTAWAQDESALHPRYRFGGAAAFDSARNVGVLFGGADDAVQFDQVGHYLGDLWEYGLSRQEPNGQVLRVPFTGANAEAGAVITGVSTRWVAGATGSGGNGVRLWVWDKGSYVVEQSAGGNLSLLGELTWKTSDPARIARLFEGPDKELGVAVTPVSDARTTPPTLTVDYAEVRVRYRRP